MNEAESPERPFSALPKPEREEPRERGLRNLELPEAVGIFFLLLVAAACGGLIAVYWPWSGSSDNSALSDKIAALELRLDQLSANRGKANIDAPAALANLKTRLNADEARLSALEQTGGTTNVPLTQLNARIAALEANAPPDLKQQLSGFALKSDEAALAARVAKLEARDPQPILKRAAAMMALSGVVRVSASGAPFANELSSLRAVAPDLPGLTELEPLAKAGVPTRPMLAARFTREAPGIIATAREAKAKNWFARLWLHVTELVSVRPVGPAKGKSTQAIVARAEMDAGGNDLDGALAELAKLDPAAHAAAKGWIDAATARAMLDKDIAVLSNAVTAMLAAPLPADAQPGVSGK